MKNFSLIILTIIGLFFIVLNVIPVNCEEIRIISTQSPVNTHMVNISSRTCKNIEDNGIYLRIEDIEKKLISETKILPNHSNDIKFNWISTKDLNIILPRNSKPEQSARELLGINYDFVYQ